MFRRRRKKQWERLLAAFERDPGPRFVYGDLQTETHLGTGRIYILLEKMLQRGYLLREFAIDKPDRPPRATYLLTFEGHRAIEVWRSYTRKSSKDS